jgi:hypothetical protein
MTIVAWDGKTLAADCEGAGSYLKISVTKIYRVRETLVAGSGNHAAFLSMVEWWRNGADIAKYPECQKADNDSLNCHFMVIDGDKRIWRWGMWPMPIEVMEPFWAIGNGGEVAIGAMAMGATSQKAVELATRYIAGCGMGMDVLLFEDRG